MKFWTVSVGLGHVSVVSRPSGDELLISDMEELAAAGVRILVSMIDEDELPIDGLSDESLAAPFAGLRFIHVPTPDREPPASTSELLALMGDLAGEVSSGSHVGVHCHAGHGRSPAFAAGVLVMAGMGPDEAMDALSAARGKQVPHRQAQREWVYRVYEQVVMEGLGPAT